MKKGEIEQVASSVPYFDRIQNLQVDRTRVQSDTKGFVAYKNASEDEVDLVPFTAITTSIWNVRFKILFRTNMRRIKVLLQRIFRLKSQPLCIVLDFFKALFYFIFFLSSMNTHTRTKRLPPSRPPRRLLPCYLLVPFSFLFLL